METFDYTSQNTDLNEDFATESLENTPIKNAPEKKTIYQEKFVNCFTEAVDTLETDNIFNNKDFNICLLDIDGVLFKDNMVKLPIASHLSKPQITERTKNAYNRLVTLTDKNLAISTNRGEKEQLIFNSQEVLNQVKQLVDSNGNQIPLFTGLFKQKPGITVEDISSIYQNPESKSETKIIKPKVDALVHYIGKLATEKDYKKYSITSIEDWSIVSLNRKYFLIYVSNQLKQLYGIDIEEIRNYVIKR